MMWGGRVKHFCRVVVLLAALFCLWSAVSVPLYAMHPTPDRRQLAPPTKANEVHVVSGLRVPLENLEVDWIEAYQHLSLMDADTARLVEIYTNVALILEGIESYALATAFLENAYEMCEKRDDTERCFRLLYELIRIDVVVGDWEQAALHLQAAQKLEFIANKDLRELILSDANGLYYQGIGKPKTAIHYFLNAVAAAKQMNVWEQISELYLHTATAYRGVGMVDIARRYLDSGLLYIQPLRFNGEMRRLSVTEPMIYTLLGDWGKAKAVLLEALRVSKQEKKEWLEAGFSLRLARIFRAEGDYEKAYQHQMEAMVLCEELNRVISQSSFKIYDAKCIREEGIQEEARGALYALLMKNQKLYTWLLLGAVSFFGLFFLLLSLRNFLRLQARDKILQEQRAQNAKRNSELIISFAHTENLRTENQFKNEQQESTRRSLLYKNSLIMNSIEYANTIQLSLRPNQDNMSMRYPNHFIIYRPNNIVSGDLFWFADLIDRSIFILADCSGHEVAGAALSFIAYMKLNQIVRETKVTDPIEIIEEFTRQFNDLWKDSTESFKMQANVKMGVLLLDYVAKKVHYAGASQALFYSEDGGVVKRYSGRMPTVSLDTPSYVRKGGLTLDLVPGMVFYMMTDGFIEQPDKENSKIGSRNVLRYLSEIVGLPMDTQRRHLLAYFARHRVGMPQVDDVTLLGFSVENTEL